MISVIIPAYNRAPTLRRAIESVLRQTVQELEVIVVDDASTDASAEIARGVEDPRVRCITHPSNRGGAVARNTGIMAAAGDYLAFLDSEVVKNSTFPNFNSLKSRVIKFCLGNFFGSLVFQGVAKYNTIN